MIAARRESELLSIFPSIVDAILPEGGLIAVLYHVYMDESGTHAGSPLMTIAGYLLKSRDARLFSREWQTDLKKLGLTCAHMTDCALGFGEYKKLSMQQRVQSEKLLIKLIRKRTILGFALSMELSSYEQIIDDTVPFSHSPYTLLLLTCVLKIRDWVVQQGDVSPRVAYFFEAGHDKANEANRFMNAIPAFGWTKFFFYAGHSFVDKKVALPLQAADMLAWQHRHYLMRLAEGHSRPRKDFSTLLRPQDVHANVKAEYLLGLRSFLKQSKQLIERNPTGWLEHVFSYVGTNGSSP